MKNIVLNKTKDKNPDKKLFTKEEKNIIINEKYNPLKVNFKLIYESEGLCVKGEILDVVKKLSTKYNKKEVLLLEMIEKSKMFGYNVKDIEELIKEFEEKSNCY